MINSKGIRILCYITMGISYFIAIILLVCGCSALVNEKVALGFILLLIAILIPFSVTLSLYPIFAISLIESNVSELNENLRLLLRMTATTIAASPASPENNRHQEQKSTAPQNNLNQSHTDSFRPPLTPTPPISESIDFINQKYKIDIEIFDNLITIKEKISKIEAVDNLTLILKKRIGDATSFDEVCSIIKMHHSVSKNTFVPVNGERIEAEK